jgi:NTE family protein
MPIDGVKTARTPVVPPTIGLALGGGGARGLAHILMLEAFEELGLRPKIIAGTSIGALFGAAYASGMPARLVRAHAEEALSQRLDIVRQLFSARAEPVLRFLNLIPIRSALLNPLSVLELLLPAAVARDFHGLRIPLRVVATDYHAQEQVVLTSGDLRRAVAASMALPALFTPVAIEGRVLMDGGLVNPLPFDVLGGQADITVAIDVSGAAGGRSGRPLPSAFSALMASSQIMQRSIVREKLKAHQPDIYIDVGVDAFYVLDFHRFREILAAAQAAKAQLRRQLMRILRSEPAQALPIAVAAEPPAPPARPRPRKRRLARIAELAKKRS